MQPTFGFGEALKELLDGQLVQRIGWNGKGMYLKYVPSHAYSVHGCSLSLLPWIGMRTAGEEGNFVPWLASQTDILATDWMMAN